VIPVDLPVSVAYVRISTDDQDPGLQKLFIESTLPDVILEDVETGTNSDRAAYQDLRKRIAAGSVHQVIVWKMDRLGRDPVELIKFFQLLEDHNVEFISTTEPWLSSCNSSPMGFFTWWMQLGLARFEILLLKERQRAGIDAARLRGVHLGRPKKHVGP